jgi:methyl-accepting chemotaxis protein
MGQSRHRRRTVIVDRKMQVGLSATVIVVLSCYLLLFCLVAVYSPFATLLTGAASIERQAQATGQIRFFLDHLLLPIGLTFACLGLHCILLTHRIAGPAYRFRVTMGKARDRDLSVDIHLRRGDYMQDVADEYNAMMTVIRRDMAEMRRQVSEIGATARDLTTRTAGAAGATAAALVERAGRVEGLLASYRLERVESESEATEEVEAAAGTPETAAVAE